MAKVLIEVKGGLVTSISSDSEKIEVIVIDYDNIEKGDQVDDIEIWQPDNVVENIYEIFTENEPLEQEIRDHLKRLKF